MSAETSFDSLRARRSAALAELRAVEEALNTAENCRIAYEFIQVMCETREKLGHGYVSLLEFTTKGTIRATVPWWGDGGPCIYHFNRRILESESYRLRRIEQIAAKRGRRDERRRQEFADKERAKLAELKAKYPEGGADG